jgi:hypothetical protein
MIADFPSARTKGTFRRPQQLPPIPGIRHSNHGSHVQEVLPAARMEARLAPVATSSSRPLVNWKRRFHDGVPIPGAHQLDALRFVADEKLDSARMRRLSMLPVTKTTPDFRWVQDAIKDSTSSPRDPEPSA